MLPSYLDPASPPPGRFRAVLFDVDGTLIDTADLIADALEHACRTHLGRTHDRNYYYSLIGKPALVQMEILGEGADPHPLLESAIEYYEAHAAEERAFPGALDTLAQLREVGIRVGLVTSKLRRELDPTLERIPLQRYVSVIVTSDLTTRPKPFPDPVYLALQTLQLPAEYVVFLGDSPYDLQSGRAAGVRTAAATWGPHPRETLAAEQPDLMAASFRDVLRYCGLGRER
ncbi:MAG: HAD-IA family hydrolase [Armatimonadetes bacterium]|nr:HAD-IA family hydrolase [Armatimonadota bacterium]